MSTKNASIQLKLAKAKNLLAEVDVLVQHKFYMTAINRLYYACFHVTKARLLTKDLIPKTHTGTVSMLHQYFVQDEAFNFDQASFFSRLMQERIEDDYNDLLKIEEAEVMEFVEPAKEYVFYVEGLIRNWEESKG
jgi:uncharacterized protein (UPF0332 family)